MGNNILQSLNYIITIGWQRRYVILLPLLIMPLIAFFYGQAQQRYTTYTTILIQDTSSLNPNLRDLANSPILMKRSSALNTLLHSRQVLENVAYKLGLINDTTIEASKTAVIQDLGERLTMELISDDLLMLKLWGKVPNETANTLKFVANSFIETILEPRISGSSGSEGFLEKQLTAARTSLSNDEKQLNTLLLKNPDVTGKNMDEEITMLRNKLQILRSRFTDNHSEVVAAFKELQDHENSQLRPLTLSVNNELKTPASSIRDIKQQLNVKRELYQSLLNRYQLAKVRGNLMAYEAPERIKIIDQPTTPIAPSSKPPIIYVIAGLFIGGGIGCALAYMLELLTGTIRYKKELEDLTGAPVLCRIPLIVDNS